MAPTTTTPGKLTFDDLMTKGYFPDRVIPPVNSMGLSVALADMLAYIKPIANGMLKSPSKLRSWNFAAVGLGRLETHAIAAKMDNSRR